MKTDKLRHSFKGDKLREDLLRRITSGTIKTGDAILPAKKLSEMYGISYQTTERVIAGLEKKGILKRFQGKGTFVVGKYKTGKNLIAVAMPGFVDDREKTDWFVFADILEGINEGAQRYGFTVRLVMIHEDRKKLMDSQSIILLNPLSSPSEMQALENKKIPYVVVNPSDSQIHHHRIICDDSFGTYQATTHLLSLGYRKIAYLGPGKDFVHTLPRYQGFLSALSELKIKPRKQIVEGIGDNLSAYIAMSDYLKENGLPEAIVAANDLRAIGAIKALKSRGIKVPEDVAIVGFDDRKEAALANPPLTTVAKPRKDMGYEAVKFLAGWLQNPERTPPFQVLLRPNLVVRESCGVKLCKAKK
jgi:DNA-binding LacI/PurR family transcriptional regulator